MISVAPAPRVRSEIRAFACDYDGTLARGGVLEASTLFAIRRLKASGRAALIVTGREWPDLRSVCPALDDFDAVVAENGALVCIPRTGKETLLCEEASESLVLEMKRRGIGHMSVGRAIISTPREHEVEAMAAIEACGGGWSPSYNKNSIMFLPDGIDKRTGLLAVLTTLEIGPEEVVGVGNAENDAPFLDACGCSFAVGNALPWLKERVDAVTEGAYGEGIAEIVDRYLLGDIPLPIRKKTPARYFP